MARGLEPARQLVQPVPLDNLLLYVVIQSFYWSGPLGVKLGCSVRFKLNGYTYLFIYLFVFIAFYMLSFYIYFVL